MKKKRKWIKWAVLAVVVLAIAAWLWAVSKTTQEVAYTQVPVTTGSITTYYNFDGLVRAGRVQTVNAAAAGTVRTVYVSENQQVEKGERLYRMEDGTTVEADIAGEVTSLPIEAGDVVTAGQKTCEIIDMSRLKVELNVDEYDVGAVTPGTSVQVTVLAKDASFEGTVTALDKNGTASGDLSYYTATVEIGDAEGVYPGMQVNAKVLRGHAENVATLKVDAINFDEYNKPYVLVRTAEGQEPEKVPVTVGVSDGLYAEIVSGVSAGDTVLRRSGMSMAELMEQMRESNSGAR
ncbi:MAG: HlyD family efflux transporter periplasmic adaptor subunit [Clostridia bacterium]|nr:HlyD family efflux transporter periplasmic adaptor subunit [Clostridia bacterium]